MSIGQSMKRNPANTSENIDDKSLEEKRAWLLNEIAI